jgi:hypothetical protein
VWEDKRSTHNLDDFHLGRGENWVSRLQLHGYETLDNYNSGHCNSDDDLLSIESIVRLVRPSSIYLRVRTARMQLATSRRFRVRKCFNQSSHQLVY